MRPQVEFYEQYDLTRMYGYTPSVVNMLTRGNGTSLLDTYSPLSTARFTLQQMGDYLTRESARAPGVQDLIDYLYQVADRFDIPREIAYRQIYRESKFDPDAVSPAGAVGIAQFMEATAREYGLVDRNDPYASLDAWGRYMRDLLTRFEGDYEQALGAYNWGQGRVLRAVQQFGASWLSRAPRETRDYVAYILGGLRDALPGGGADEWFDPTTGMPAEPGSPGAMRRPPSGFGSRSGEASGCGAFDIGCHLENFFTGDTARDIAKRIGLVVLALVLVAVAVVSLR